LISSQRFSNIFSLIGVLNIVRRRDDHSRSTDPALSAAVFVKRLLEFVK
jgi:hypothetical protein